LLMCTILFLKKFDKAIFIISFYKGTQFQFC
jgi:hypothetical protein